MVVHRISAGGGSGRRGPRRWWRALRSVNDRKRDEIPLEYVSFSSWLPQAMSDLDEGVPQHGESTIGSDQKGIATPIQRDADEEGDFDYFHPMFDENERAGDSDDFSSSTLSAYISLWSLPNAFLALLSLVVLMADQRMVNSVDAYILIFLKLVGVGTLWCLACEKNSRSSLWRRTKLLVVYSAVWLGATNTLYERYQTGNSIVRGQLEQNITEDQGESAVSLEREVEDEDSVEDVSDISFGTPGLGASIKSGKDKVSMESEKGIMPPSSDQSDVDETVPSREDDQEPGRGTPDGDASHSNVFINANINSRQYVGDMVGSDQNSLLSIERNVERKGILRSLELDSDSPTITKPETQDDYREYFSICSNSDRMIHLKERSNGDRFVIEDISPEELAKGVNSNSIPENLRNKEVQHDDNDQREQRDNVAVVSSFNQFEGASVSEFVLEKSRLLNGHDICLSGKGVQEMEKKAPEEKPEYGHPVPLLPDRGTEGTISEDDQEVLFLASAQSTFAKKAFENAMFLTDEDICGPSDRSIKESLHETGTKFSQVNSQERSVGDSSLSFSDWLVANDPTPLTWWLGIGKYAEIGGDEAESWIMIDVPSESAIDEPASLTRWFDPACSSCWSWTGMSTTTGETTFDDILLLRLKSPRGMVQPIAPPRTVTYSDSPCTLPFCIKPWTIAT